MRKAVIRLKVDELMKAAQEKGVENDTALAASLGVSLTQVWRSKLPCTDPRYCLPGTTLIAGVLHFFGGPFERFFSLDESLQPCNERAASR